MKKKTKKINHKSYHVNCWHCEGNGFVLREIKDPGGYIKGAVQEKCPVCKGKKVVFGKKEEVPECATQD